MDSIYFKNNVILCLSLESFRSFRLVLILCLIFERNAFKKKKKVEALGLNTEDFKCSDRPG